jgi:hypothetical protein
MPGRSVSKYAYAAIVLFVIGMALVMTQNPPTSFVGRPPTIVVAVTLAFVGFHLVLLPVVSALEAPGWAKGSGYAWIVVDNIICFLSYFGVGPELIIPMRWGVHLAAATWIFGASAAAGGGVRIVGWIATIAFLAASFAGPFVGVANAGKTLGPAGLLLVTWLAMVGMRLRGRAA